MWIFQGTENTYSVIRKSFVLGQEIAVSVAIGALVKERDEVNITDDFNRFF